MTMHTPTPWKFNDQHWTDQRATLQDAEGHCLAILKHDTDDAANAKFIVSAVNSHAELVAALQSASKILTLYGNLFSAAQAERHRNRGADMLREATAARAALAKAME